MPALITATNVWHAWRLNFSDGQPISLVNGPTRILHERRSDGMNFHHLCPPAARGARQGARRQRLHPFTTVGSRVLWRCRSAGRSRGVWHFRDSAWLPDRRARRDTSRRCDWLGTTRGRTCTRHHRTCAGWRSLNQSVAAASNATVPATQRNRLHLLRELRVRLPRVGITPNTEPVG
jgi:hypothetical protein